MYTVSISDDGMFSAEYVVPAALSIPLGSSGSAVDVIKNEDGTFSALIGGEYEVVNADTMVTAENGNVYRALLSPEGIVIGVMHVAAMQDVMLGALGGTITLTQAEDMSWWYGEAAVASGYVHTADNGNMYALTLDSEGMWSAMYQQVEVTVALGTQGSIVLVRAEDMSWWYGTEGVDVASEVMSPNGNTYTLWYTDGVWSARFEPESMMIEGTGLVAMTREADDMYDVGDSTLAATGVGDVTDGDAMYHVWMQDGGGLAGARFDGKIGKVNLKVSDLADKVALSSDNEKGLLAAMGHGEDVTTTVANEAGTHLKVADNYYSIGTLLGTGSAEAVGSGTTIVEGVRAALSNIRNDAALALNIFDEPGQANALRSALDDIWARAKTEVGKVFPAAKVSLSANPRYSDKVLDDLDERISALESEDAFAAATVKGGGGVFTGAELNANNAALAFAASKTESSVALQALGEMRFGAVWRKTRADATKKDPGIDALGAFAYSMIDNETRVRNIDQGTGRAFYAGKTQAVDGKGNFVSGDIDLQVRFNANKVTGELTNLRNDADDSDWEYLYSNVPVKSILLPEATLRSNAGWSQSGQATVEYITTAGVPRPTRSSATFLGQLLKGGNQAIGTWEFGSDRSGGVNYLAGSFGAERGADLEDLRPGEDDGTGAVSMVLPSMDIAANPDKRGQTIANGNLKIISENSVFDPTASSPDGARVVMAEDATTTARESERTHTFKLATIFADAGTVQTVSGAKYSESAIATLETQRAIIATDLEIAAGFRQTAWTEVRNALARQIFGVVDGDLSATATSLPGLFGAGYATSASTTRQDYVRAIDEAISALMSGDALKAALTQTTGIFYKESATNTGSADNDNTTADVLDDLFGIAGKDVDLEKIGDVANRVVSRAKLFLGNTSFTRFGAWRLETAYNAVGQYFRDDAGTANGNGPNAFAYSPLTAASYSGTTDPAYPGGTVMTYTGETVAVQRNTFFSGQVTVEVAWSAAALGGFVSAVISNLEDVGTGDPMYFDSAFGTDDTTDAAGLPLPGNPNALDEVRQIVIAGTAVAPNATTDALEFSDANATPQIVAGTLGSAQIAIGDGAIEGKFVGLGLSGPLAVLGAWSISNNLAGQKIGAVNETAYDAATNTAGTITVRSQAIHGAFGAEAP